MRHNDIYSLTRTAGSRHSVTNRQGGFNAWKHYPQFLFMVYGL